MSLFHERFNELREKSGKTQTSIAKELGMSKQQLSYYVNGREPDYDTLIKIAKLFNISIDYLLGVIDEKVTLKQNLHSNFIQSRFNRRY